MNGFIKFGVISGQNVILPLSQIEEVREPDIDDRKYSQFCKTRIETSDTIYRSIATLEEIEAKITEANERPG